MKKYLKLLFVSVEPLKMVLLNLLPNLCVVTNYHKRNVAQTWWEKGKIPVTYDLNNQKFNSYFQMYEILERQTKNGLLKMID